MSTRIERVLASLADLNNCELDFIRSSITNQVNKRQETAKNQPCRLLDLAAELRNRIYGYVVIAHLQEEANLVQKPGLLDCNQQIRREFGDIYYGSQTMILQLFSGFIKSSSPIVKEAKRITITDRELIGSVLSEKAPSGCSYYRDSPEDRAFSPYTKVPDVRGMGVYRDVRRGQLEETWLGKTTEFRFRRVCVDLELLREYGYEKDSVLPVA